MMLGLYPSKRPLTMKETIRCMVAVGKSIDRFLEQEKKKEDERKEQSISSR